MLPEDDRYQTTSETTTPFPREMLMMETQQRSSVTGGRVRWSSGAYVPGKPAHLRGFNWRYDMAPYDGDV